jgi:hypothetical protein
VLAGMPALPRRSTCEKVGRYAAHGTVDVTTGIPIGKDHLEEDLVLDFRRESGEGHGGGIRKGFRGGFRGVGQLLVLMMRKEKRKEKLRD